jgi:hypothetical protein
VRNPLQSSNPISEFNITGQRHKKVQVIGKNDVTPDGNRKIALRASTKLHECLINTIIRQMRPAPIRAASYEVNRSSCEDDIEPTRRSREFCHEVHEITIQPVQTSFAVDADLWAARRTQDQRRASQSEASTAP